MPAFAPIPLRDTAEAAGASTGLPEWDLSDLYPAPDSPELAADLSRAAAEAEAFAEAYQGRIATLSGVSLGEALIAYEALTERLQRIMSYAQLVHAASVSDPTVGRFYQDTQERVTDISSRILFFTLEINRLEDVDLKAKLVDPVAARYRPWLDDLRLMKDHQLSDEQERLLHEKAVSGRNAWMRLFDETMADLRIPLDDAEPVTLTEALDRLSDPEPDQRRTAGKAIGGALAERGRLFALITNTLAKDKEIEDRWRNFAHPMAARNLSNLVEDEVVDALISAVRDSHQNLSHRYYAIKAGWMGQGGRLDWWDRNAPLPDDDDRRFSWQEARDTVLGAYHAFSPDLADIGRRFFDNAWIDAPARAGKAGGAFAHPTVPGVHPYLLLNYMGRTRDVMTLAHELGHGVHQVLAAGQGALMADTPLTLAETASVFGEMMTFRAMLDQATDPRRRRTMLAGKVEDMLNTVVRQVAFCEFEKRVHAARREGEVEMGQLCDMWMAVQEESLGPALRFDNDYRFFWAYIPHFIHSPFYVYAYAFGDCLVNSLYDVHQRGEVPDFQNKYLDMLRAGGTLRHGALLAPFGLDAADPDFWKRGLKVLEGFIDQLEEVA